MPRKGNSKKEINHGHPSTNPTATTGFYEKKKEKEKEKSILTANADI